jgi:hypothetical protein
MNSIVPGGGVLAKSVLDIALEYAARGLPVFPCLNLPGADGHKRPLTPHGFYDASTDPTKITTWWARHPTALIGMPTGATSGIAVVDLDRKKGKDGFAVVTDWEQLSPVIARTGGGGAHLWFKAVDRIRSATGQDGVDVRGEGGYIILPGSAGYSWLRGDLSVELPPFPETYRPPDYVAMPAEELEAEDPAEVVAALEAIPNDDLDYDNWVRIGMAMFAATGGGDDGLKAWHEWSAKSGKYDLPHTDKRWRSFHRSPPNSIGAGTLFFEANAADPFWRDEHRRAVYEATARELEQGEAQFVAAMGVKAQPTTADSPATEPLAPERPSPAETPEPTSVEDQPADPEPSPEVNEPDAKPESPTPPPPSLLGEWNAGADHDPIPPRRWLLGNVFCRSFVSALIADGGGGKTALRLLQAVALATGKPLTGEHVFKRCRVLFISLEDDRHEIRRRLRAIMLHYDIQPEELDGWLFLSAPEGKAGKLVKTDRFGTPKIGAMKAELSQAIAANSIDLVILDPLVKAHDCEENDNTAMDVVIQVLANLAAEHNIAVDVLHHTAKGGADPGNADRGRGASAVKNGARLVYTLTKMSVDEARLLGIDETERRSYVRIDSGKVNITPSLDRARWFQIVGVELGNSDALYKGDNVQTVEPWTPPDEWDGIGNELLRRIVDDIGRGIPADPDAGIVAGTRYSAHPRARARAAWPVVQRHAPDKNEIQCKAIIASLLRQRLIVENAYRDPARREMVSGLVAPPPEDQNDEPI